MKIWQVINIHENRVVEEFKSHTLAKRFFKISCLNKKQFKIVCVEKEIN